jgi:transmembrane sensor|tara:strand:- start:186 stop:1244 length:1059 start_codon:yes stop_codon:yes gene_type:complete
MMYSRTSKINQEACAWIAKLHGAEPSPQELEALRDWMQQSPENKAELRRMAKRWDELNVLTELAVPVEIPGVRKTRKGSFFLGSFGRRVWVGAFAAAAVFMFITVLWPQLSFNRDAPSSLAYSTAIGEQRLVTLPDNSTVLLNTNSQVRVDYTRKFRNLHLVQGEAHFDVSSNPDRPFQVYAGKGMVRAVGTAFSIYLKEKIVEVTVVEGVVEINVVQDTFDINKPSKDTGENLTIINAGQSAIFDQNIGSIALIETSDQSEISRKLSWHEGLLRFSGDPLEEVVNEVSRYTSLSIVILDPELRGLRIGGFFKVGETDKMFEALEAGFDVRVERIDENLVHLSAITPATSNP